MPDDTERTDVRRRLGVDAVSESRGESLGPAIKDVLEAVKDEGVRAHALL